MMDFGVSLLQLIEQAELLWTSLSSPHRYSSECLQSVGSWRSRKTGDVKLWLAQGEKEVAVLLHSGYACVHTHTPAHAYRPPWQCLGWCGKEASTATGIATGEMPLMWRGTGLRSSQLPWEMLHREGGQEGGGKESCPGCPPGEAPTCCRGALPRRGSRGLPVPGDTGCPQESTSPAARASVPGAGAAPAPCCSGPAARRVALHGRHRAPRPAAPCCTTTKTVCQMSRYKSINVSALSIALLHPQGRI